MTQYTLVLSQSDIVWPGVIQGIGLGLVFVPLSAATFATLSPQMRAEGTALYSLIRNIGSSIGIALVQTLLVRNTQIAHASLTPARCMRPTRRCSTRPAATAWRPSAGAALINNEITRQASMIAYVDDYWLMMMLTAAVIPLLLLIRPPKAQAGPAPVDHAALD
jgi:DHA2 family multidrug resistance protein